MHGTRWPAFREIISAFCANEQGSIHVLLPGGGPSDGGPPLGLSTNGNRMRILPNVGNERVVDELSVHLASAASVDVLSGACSLFAYHSLDRELGKLIRARVVLPADEQRLELLGSTGDREARNQLRNQSIARDLAEWLKHRSEVRITPRLLGQAMLLTRDASRQPTSVLSGTCDLTTAGLGLTPQDQHGFVQVADSDAERAALSTWFENLWAGLPSTGGLEHLLRQVERLAADEPPALIYLGILYHLFHQQGDGLDEERVVRAATGIRDTMVWKKLYRFQRDGVVGAIDKLERYGGCIIADSVGLGKTFEALAIIKYHELRNDRVLVLCPKRLRDNWTIYTANDRRNILAADRFNFDVLNHTDLSREQGMSGDIDLAHVNWGNYDLVVIDESHNFRNKKTPRAGGDTRYDRLMRRIIREGVKTRVLMLSATPVNNRLADLRNQLAFATEGNDTALADAGIPSIDATTRLAQKQFNKWLDLEEAERTPGRLIEMLGFDYFTLLDLLTIARSRKHIERYYGTSETGKFPERLRPINCKVEVDRAGQFRSIKEINLEIRRLTLAAYAPLRYVLPHKRAAYDARYSTELREGKGTFRQADREESLVHLLRVNVLKRMESSVSSFALTLERQRRDVDAILDRIEQQSAEVEELNIDDLDFDDPNVESLLVGREVKVLLADVDVVRWKQDLLEDRNRLDALLSTARVVDHVRDAKLEALRAMIREKCAAPINAGNRKVIVFTAFADTAKYLYEHLAPWARESLGLESALVTGAGRNQTTLPGLRRDLASILSAFSPRSRERPDDLAAEGDLDLLIATDCISEGQNLQDCDWLINYDIHWNPVRIIQRFGRIDRLGSPNERIQLVNFWPNMELEEYINLEQRVSGRMVLLDISATGEENVIRAESGNQMNDLEYRRKQLLRLQDAVIDMDDLSAGVSITDLTLTDLRIDLATCLRERPGVLEGMPLGAMGVVRTLDVDVPPGIIFCLRGETEAANARTESSYPLAPHYLVHVGADGAVLLGYAQARLILERLKRLCLGRDLGDAAALEEWESSTRRGTDMRRAQELLAAAVGSIVGRGEERALASLFTPGGTHTRRGEFAGINDFEVVTWLVVLASQ